MTDKPEQRYTVTGNASEDMDYLMDLTGKELTAKDIDNLKIISQHYISRTMDAEAEAIGTDQVLNELLQEAGKITWIKYNPYDRGIESHKEMLVTDGKRAVSASHVNTGNGNYNWIARGTTMVIGVTHYARINLPEGSQPDGE